MSKLAHSNQETMDEIDRKRAIENGDEDLIPLLGPNAFVQAFKRNCPNVRMTKDEEFELWRLFAVQRHNDRAR